MPTTDECLELFRYLTSLAGLLTFFISLYNLLINFCIGSRTKLTIDTLSKVSMFVVS
jgi:hypothetical protein